MTETEKDNQGRSDEAKDPEREGGVGPRETPPGQDKPKPEDEPEVDNSLPEEPPPA